MTADINPLPEPAVTHDALGGLYTPLQVRARVEASTEALREQLDAARREIVATAHMVSAHYLRAERLAEALRIAEAALADIGDADREPGDDVAWCERRARLGLKVVRDTLRDHDQEVSK